MGVKMNEAKVQIEHDGPQSIRTRCRFPDGYRLCPGKTSLCVPFSICGFMSAGIRLRFPAGSVAFRDIGIRLVGHCAEALGISAFASAKNGELIEECCF
jgi:hypothetical protein